jgi:hypothetical protein
MLFVWPIVWPLQVFLRAGGMAQLDKLRTEHMAGAATTVQRHVRGYLQRLRYVALRSAALLLQRSVRAVLARRVAQRLREEKAALVIQVGSGCLRVVVVVVHGSVYLFVCSAFDRCALIRVYLPLHGFAGVYHSPCTECLFGFLCLLLRLFADPLARSPCIAVVPPRAAAH